MRIIETKKADRYLSSTGHCFFHRDKKDKNCPYCQEAKKEKKEIITISDTGY
jgi:hypothetical protein